MDFTELLDEHRVVIGSTATTWAEVLAEIGGRFRTGEEVTNGFVEALIERERNYPTGLPVEPIGVAIPHADGQYVLKSGFAVMTLPNEVLFGQMGSPSTQVGARLIVCIALPEEKRVDQAEALGWLIERLQNEDFVAGLLKAEKVDEALRLFRQG